MNVLTDLEIPLPFWVAAFSVILGAIVTAAVSKYRADKAIIAEATEIKGEGEPPTLDEAKGIVGANRTLQRANESLQICNRGLEQELTILKNQFAGTKRDLATAVKRIDELETAIRTLRTVGARRISAGCSREGAGMSVYVDNMQRTAVLGCVRSLYSNLSADSRAELLDFVRRLGLKANTGQHWDSPLYHFVITEGMRKRAIELGAIPVSSYELLRRRLGKTA